MRYLASVILALALAAPAFAGHAAPAQTVKDSASVASAAKGCPVLLEGMLIRQMPEEMFLFEDASGDVIVEIDDDIMRARDVSPDSKVRLHGRVDHDGGIPYVEVDTVEVLD